LSDARTGVLPRLAAKAATSSYTAGSVKGDRTTSTSFIRGTGLKKCRPTKRDGRFVVAAISVMERDEVLEAKIASGRQAASRAWKTWRLTSRLSVTTSMTRSHSPIFASSVVPSSRERTSALRSGVTFPFSTPLVRKRSMLPRPFFRKPSSTSRTSTWYPASAQTCAMPEPMSPQPTTPTDFIDTFRGVLTALAPPCAFGYPPTRSRRSEFGARCAPSRLPLDDHRDALTAADAGGGEAEGAPAPAQLVDEG